MVCTFTGHRHISAEETLALSGQIDALLEELISEGYTEFRAGGAIGFDTLVALRVIEKKKKYGFIRLELYLPCPEQGKDWSSSMKRIYDFSLKHADAVKYSCRSYVTGCMQLRNREMVDGSDTCVAYCKSRTGGTYYTVSYARKKGIRVINLYE